MSPGMSVEETVKKIAQRILRKKDIAFATTTTFKDFGADSLDIVQILVAVEDTFDIELDDEQLRNINDTAGFIAYIERKIAEKDNK
jgi:acyl carrier protein